MTKNMNYWYIENSSTDVESIKNYRIKLMQ